MVWRESRGEGKGEGAPLYIDAARPESTNHVMPIGLPEIAQGGLADVTQGHCYLFLPMAWQDLTKLLRVAEPSP